MLLSNMPNRLFDPLLEVTQHFQPFRLLWCLQGACLLMDQTIEEPRVRRVRMCESLKVILSLKMCHFLMMASGKFWIMFHSK